MDKTTKSGWQPHQILVAVDGGRASHDGFVNAEFPGLGIHHTSDLGWIITHLPSGAAMLAGCPSRQYVQTAAKTFAAAADWTAPLEALRYRSELQDIARSFTVAYSRWARANTKAAPESGVRHG